MESKKYLERLISKVNRLIDSYTPLIESGRYQLKTYIYQTKEHYTRCPSNVPFAPIEIGDVWGENFGYAWFKFDDIQLPFDSNENIYLHEANGGVESLVFVNDVPYGMTDDVIGQLEVGLRLHQDILLPNLKGCNITLESYASHTFVGTQPRESKQTFAMRGYVGEKRVFNGMYIITKNAVVDKFVDRLKLLSSLYASPLSDIQRADVARDYERLSVMLDYMPSEHYSQHKLIQATQLIEEMLFDRQHKSLGEVALVGHSHLDTAWLWTIPETKRKLARTVANAVTMLERYDQYKFCISSVLYLQWIEQLYPQLFDRMLPHIKSGRLEIVGGAYVECDCNLVSGQSLVRQFVRGQHYLLDKFGFCNDNFFLPDTFGYSASLPQILRSVNIKSFFTTKMEWNDLNKFPYDTFVWQGIDNSEVVTHLGTIQAFPNAKCILDKVEAFPNKHLNTRGIICYGYGDGGGGPNDKMIESAIDIGKVKYMPQVYHSRVDEFFNGFDSATLPRYYGELYLELHRGTLTSNSKIKRNNRKLEIAIANFQLISVCAVAHNNNSQVSQQIDTMLINQFHDILPGTSINEVNDSAIADNTQALTTVKHNTLGLLSGKGKDVVLYNVTQSRYTGNVDIAGEYGIPTYKGLDGNARTVFDSVDIEGYSSAKYSAGNTDNLFVFDNGILSTPFYQVQFNDNMDIVHLYDKTNNRVVNNGILGQYVLYDDVPAMWDNWDIDYGYEKFDKAYAQLTKVERIYSANSEYRLRCYYKIANSTITHDIVLYSNSRLINYKVRVDNNERHKLLKVHFDTNVFAHSIKSEIQYGHLDRATHTNTLTDIARFEYCNHYWSDVSEHDYGVTLINDCKYGISAKGGNMALSLIKSGTHPDTRADIATHYFDFALLPHSGAFDVDTVVIPALQYNTPPIAVVGGKEWKVDISIDNNNIIIDSIAFAQKGDDTIVTLVERSQGSNNATLAVGQYSKAYYCNLLQQEIEQLPITEGGIALQFAPFEIKTIKLCK